MVFLKKRKEWALFFARFSIGLLLFLTAIENIFGVFGGQGIEAVVSQLSIYGITSWVIRLVIYLQALVGAMLIFGVVTEVAAGVVFLACLGVLSLMCVKWGFLPMKESVDIFLLAIVTLVILIGGPGKCALWSPWCCNVCTD